MYQTAHTTPLRNERGAALAEVIVAILILLSGSIAALSLMDSILDVSTASNNTIIAVNLAREGIEAVRSVRDSNWLKYSGSQRDADDETRDHWNDGFDCSPSACPDPPVIHLRAKLERVGGDNDLQWAIDTYDPTKASDVRSEIVGDTGSIGDYYRLVLEDAAPSSVDPLGTMYNYNDALGTPSQFYRQIKITYLNSYDGDLDIDVKDNMVFVESKVLWHEDTQIRTAELNTILTDWYGREDHIM